MCALSPHNIIVRVRDAIFSLTTHLEPISIKDVSAKHANECRLHPIAMPWCVPNAKVDARRRRERSRIVS
jgi:hypothetical protein